MAARVAFANDLAPISTNYLLAMVFILFAYGGWNETAAVAAEVEIPQRNMLRGLTLGTGVVVACYLLVNVALLGGLGFDNLAASNAAVAELLQLATGDIGAKLISAAVCISCMGAINGMLFTGARLYYALGVQEPAFRWLGHWNQRLGTPVRTLVLQTLVAIGLIEVFGRTSDAFNTLVIFTTPVFWSFLLLVSIAVVVLRLSDPKTLRPFRLPFFPLEPLIFAAASGLMIYSSVNYMVAPFHERNFAYRFAASTAFVPAIAGLVVFLLTRLGAKRAKV
jgi:amino acid transporter